MIGYILFERNAAAQLLLLSLRQSWLLEAMSPGSLEIGDMP